VTVEKIELNFNDQHEFKGYGIYRALAWVLWALFEYAEELGLGRPEFGKGEKMEVLEEFELSYANRIIKVTIVDYLNDLQQFSRWFERTNGEIFTLQGVTPTDVREYRQPLLVVDCRKANTINRWLAALFCLMKWATQNGW